MTQGPAAAEGPAFSNDLLGVLLGEEDQAEGMSDELLNEMNRRHKALTSATWLDRGDEMGADAHDSILDLLRRDFDKEAESIDDAIELGQDAATSASLTALGAGIQASTSDELDLVGILQDEATETLQAVSDFVGDAAEHLRLPDQPRQIDTRAKNLGAEVSRVTGELSLEIDRANQAVRGASRARSKADARAAVLPHIDTSAGGNQDYLIGALIEGGVDTDYILDICADLGISNARYAEALSGEQVSTETDPSGAVTDLVPTLNSLSTVCGAMGDGQLDKELQMHVSGFSEHGSALSSAYRVHAHMVDAWAMVGEADQNGTEVSGNDLEFAIEALNAADAEWSQASDEITALRKGSLADQRSGIPGLGTAVMKLNHTEHETRVRAKLDELRLTTDVMLAAEVEGGGLAIPTPNQLAVALEDTVKAGRAVEAATFGLFSATGIKGFSKVVDFAANDLRAMSLEEIAKKAKEGGLTTKDRWDQAATWASITKSVAGALEEVTEHAGSALSDSSRELWKAGDKGLAVARRGKAVQMARFGKTLGRVGLVGDLIGAAQSISVLCDPSASKDDKIDAGISLAGAGVGIGTSIAGGAAATAGTAFGLGLAYVQLLRSEFKRIAAIEKNARGMLRKGAFDNVMKAAQKALVFNERLVAVESLMTDGNGDLIIDETVDAKMEELASKAWSSTRTLDNICIEVTKSEHVSEAMVGWKGEADALRATYESDRGDAGSTLRSADSEASTDELHTALKGGAPGIFEAAGNLADNIKFFHSMDD